MITSAAKHVLGLVGLAFICLIGYTAGDIVLDGADTPRRIQSAIYLSIFEWRPGDLFGVALLATVVLAGSFLLVAVLLTRDSAQNAEAIDETPVMSPSYWPMASAFGLGIAAVGLVADTLVFVFGCLVVGVAAFEWAVTAWTDRHSSDAVANHGLRNRLMVPLEIPVFAIVLVAIPVIMLSRVLLASSKNGAPVIATVIALLILVVFFVLYARPGLDRGLIASVSVIGAVAIIVAGVVAAAVGQRDFERHIGEDHGEVVVEEGA